MSLIDEMARKALQDAINQRAFDAEAYSRMTGRERELYDAAVARERQRQAQS